MIVIDGTGRVTRRDSSGDALIVFADAPSAGNVREYASELGHSLSSWLTAQGVSPQEASLLYDLTVFGTVPARS